MACDESNAIFYMNVLILSRLACESWRRIQFGSCLVPRTTRLTVAGIDRLQMLPRYPGQVIDFLHIRCIPIRHMKAGEKPADMKRNAKTDPPAGTIFQP